MHSHYGPRALVLDHFLPYLSGFVELGRISFTLLICAETLNVGSVMTRATSGESLIFVPLDFSGSESLGAYPD